MSSWTRRRLLRDGLVAGVVLPWVSPKVAANATVNIGLIGCRSMGFSNLQAMLNVPGTRCVALCDVDQSVLSKRRQDVFEMTGTTPTLYRDYRTLLDDKDVDAVIIGTPDHWHCLQMVDASSAGKHVYVEKPLANSVTECTSMIAAQERYGNVVQVGQWQRSGPHWQEAMDYVHGGQLGQIRTVKSWAYMNWLKLIKPVPNTAAPDGVDYDMWLGPAPKRPFNTNRFHFHFRWFWDYAGGLMTDWGVHLIDIVLWGMQAQHPQRVMSSGGAFAYPDSAMQTPDTQQAIYEFDDFTMIWEHAVGIGLGPYRRSHGIAFVGNNGTLVVDRNGWEVIAESERDTDGEDQPKLDAPVPRTVQPEERGLLQHTANFIAAIRDGTPLNCDVKTGSGAAINAHLGNIALRTGATLDWRGERLTFKNQATANSLLTPDYRRPWRLPLS